MCPLLETPELGFENVTRASISVGVSRKRVEFESVPLMKGHVPVHFYWHGIFVGAGFGQRSHLSFSDGQQVLHTYFIDVV